MRNEELTAPSRGDATRAALIEAGLELFGARGYEGTSSRALADRAGVNQALIGYHFRGKKGLYLAVFEAIARRVREHVQPSLEAGMAQLESAGPEGVTPEMAREMLFTVLDRFVDLFASPETERWAQLIMREQQRPGEAFEIVWVFMSRTLGLLSRLVGILRGRTPADLDVRLLVISIMGQVLVFRIARASVLRHLGWDEVGAEEVELIKAQLRNNVLRQLEDSSS